MLELILFFISLGLIWVAWGFWPFLIAIALKITLVKIFKPTYDWDSNWGALLGNLLIVIAGIVAVNAIWHEPIYNAAAVVIAVVLMGMELKG